MTFHASFLALVFAALIAPAARGGDDAPRQLTAEQAALVGKTRVVVLISPLDEVLAEALVKNVGLLALQTVGAGVMVGAYAGAAAVSAGSYGAGATMFAAVAPLAVLAGAGTLAGGIQRRNREIAAANAMAIPLQAAFKEQLSQAEIDARFVAALAAELTAIPWLERDGDIVVIHASDREQRRAMRKLLEDTAPEDARSLLVVDLKAAMPSSLSAYAVVADTMLYSARVHETMVLHPTKRPTKYKWAKTPLPPQTVVPGEWRDEPVVRFASRIGALTPVPVTDLYRKPKEWIEREEAVIAARYDALIDSPTTRFDYRRTLRTQRNAELEEVRGPWKLLQLTTHMAAAWQTPEGLRYREVVGTGIETFARDVAQQVGRTAPADATE